MCSQKRKHDLALSQLQVRDLATDAKRAAADPRQQRGFAAGLSGAPKQMPWSGGMPCGPGATGFGHGYRAHPMNL